MATAGRVYDPVPEDRGRWADPSGRRPAWEARYPARVRPLAEPGEPLRRQGGRVGMDAAERRIALPDGGSGPAEGACETVTGQRMKGGGVRRGEDGADAVAHLRALFRSEKPQWEAFRSQN